MKRHKSQNKKLLKTIWTLNLECAKCRHRHRELFSLVKLQRQGDISQAEEREKKLLMALLKLKVPLQHFFFSALFFTRGVYKMYKSLQIKASDKCLENVNVKMFCFLKDQITCFAIVIRQQKLLWTLFLKAHKEQRLFLRYKSVYLCP